MLRTLLFFVKLAIVVFVAVWLAQQPGEVSLEWLGYRVDTSVGVLLFGTFLFGIVAALLYRFWGSLWHVPGQIGEFMGRGRRQRGYRALTQGMVAVAAGDKEEARRWARKADTLLDDAPLTMLLSAQAAQLEGDERAACADSSMVSGASSSSVSALRAQRRASSLSPAATATMPWVSAR